MKTLSAIIAALCSSALFAQESPRLIISQLAPDHYTYTTFRLLDGSLFPSNSMYMVTQDGVVMIDGPWDTTQLDPLLDSIWARHQKKVILCIATHFHDDRTGCFNRLRNKGIPTWSSYRTWQLSAQRGEKQSLNYFTSDTVFNFAGHSLETFYPGHGHTKDNITVWFPDEKILYGGCFVKSLEAKGLGNTADASLALWPVSMRNLMEKYPKSKFVIPGHQGGTDKEALKHTLRLLKDHKEKE